MKYIVYITTNIVNNKIYIGVHKTNTPEYFDGYLGCGAWVDTPSSYNKGKTPLHAAILKYGTKSFIRHTLKVFDTLDEALQLESLLVTEEFIKDPTNYNATVGGGIPPLTTKPVYQFKINGEFVKEWDSATSVCDYYQCHVSLSSIIKDKRSFAGYFWSHTPTILIDEYKKEIKFGYINQYNCDGQLLNQFKNATIASQKLDIPREVITTAVFKKKICRGFYFLKADVDIAEVLSMQYKKTLGKQIIYRYKITGEFDAEFTSTTKAVSATKGAHASALKNAVVNGYTCGGYKWSYKKADNYYDIENPKEDSKKIRIAQYDLNGNLIKIWDSIKKCKEQFTYCLRVCRGDLKSTKNYIFKYVD